jgi:phosphatidylserine/phosphatidylglycerophosphate/cardiolipin synthase-like enzyme
MSFRAKVLIAPLAAMRPRQHPGLRQPGCWLAGDVKIIMSEYETVGYLEQLQAAGLEVVSNVKIQNNVHNKGIIVDSATLLVSSQNWSTDGTLYNRDAGVIIHNPKLASYFQTIFLHDWATLAHQQAASD